MVRKQLSADGLIKRLKGSFAQIDDHREEQNIQYSLSDALLSAFSAFSLKTGSLNSFYKELNDDVNVRENIKNLYCVDEVPSASQLRAIIDDVHFTSFRESFSQIFGALQRGGALKKFKFLDEYYILSGDGSQYFSSKTIHCDNCMVKEHKDGSKTYYHQVYAGSIVHPNIKEVIPVFPEPIQKTDGMVKNDCERNASRRFFENFREDHPKLNVIVVEDGLSSNAPHIKHLKKLNFHFVVGVRENDHKYMLDWVKSFDNINSFSRELVKGKRVKTLTTQTIRYLNNVPLNYANDDLKVNYLEVIEKVEKIDWMGNVTQEKKTTFTWVTDIEITQENAFDLMEAGRKRWGIENETFNTLKNQGYSLEHNYGHGKNYLSTNLMMLMFLAFLIDEVQFLCCETFNTLKAKFSTKKLLWEKLRSFFRTFVIQTNWSGFYKFIINPEAIIINTS